MQFGVSLAAWLGVCLRMYSLMYDLRGVCTLWQTFVHIQSEFKIMLRAYREVYRQVDWECHWEDLEYHVTECSAVCLWVLSAYFGPYSQAGWEGRSSARWSILETMPVSIHNNVLRDSHGSAGGVSLGVSWELTWQRIVKQDGSASSSAIGSGQLCQHEIWSVLESLTGSVHENVLGSALGSVLCVY